MTDDESLYRIARLQRRKEDIVKPKLHIVVSTSAVVIVASLVVLTPLEQIASGEVPGDALRRSAGNSDTAGFKAATAAEAIDRAQKGTAHARTRLQHASRSAGRSVEAAVGAARARLASAGSSRATAAGRPVAARDNPACVGVNVSEPPGSFDYVTCMRRPEPTVVLFDPLLDFNLRVLEVAASGNDSRSLSLIGDLIAFGGTCIVGFTPLGVANTDSASDPNGTSSTSQGRGTLPITAVELAYVSVPTDPAERPAAGVAMAVATTPSGDARSSGAVTRKRARSSGDATGPGTGVGLAIHSEDVL